MITDFEVLHDGLQQDLATLLGLTPRQHSSGGKNRLLAISKHGDAYLRTLLIHGARAVPKVAGQKDDPRSRWLQNLCGRRNKNIAAVCRLGQQKCANRLGIAKQENRLPAGGRTGLSSKANLQTQAG